MRRRGVGQEAMQDARQVQPRQHVGHFLAGEHVVGDEPPQRLTQPPALVGNDGGMRNWYAQRMAKQRGYREPIRDAADKPGLRGRLQQAAPPVRRHEVGGDGQGGHQDQQAGGEHAVIAQGPPSEGIGIGFGHRRLFRRAPLFRPTRCNVIL